MERNMVPYPSKTSAGTSFGELVLSCEQLVLHCRASASSSGPTRRDVELTGFMVDWPRGIWYLCGRERVEQRSGGRVIKWKKRDVQGLKLKTWQDGNRWIFAQSLKITLCSP